MTQQDHVVSVATRSAALADISDAEYAARQETISDTDRAARIVLSRRQLFLGLSDALALDESDGAPDAYILGVIAGSGLADAQKLAASNEVRFAVAFERAHPLIGGVGALFGFSSDDLDDLFIASESL